MCSAVHAPSHRMTALTPVEDGPGSSRSKPATPAPTGEKPLRVHPLLHASDASASSTQHPAPAAAKGSVCRSANGAGGVKRADSWGLPGSVRSPKVPGAR